jgi:hypothetical protein
VRLHPPRKTQPAGDPDSPITTPFFPALTFMSPENSRTIACETRKNAHDVSPTDGAHEPASIPARPIAPGTLALKFRQPKFFWFESSRAEKFSARNLKNQKIVGLKVENSKKNWRESWKKRCQLDNQLTPCRKSTVPRSYGIGFSKNFFRLEI